MDRADSTDRTMEMETVTCIFGRCDTATHPTLIVEHGYTGKKCPECGLISLSPRPTHAAIQAMYRDDQVHMPAGAMIAEAPVKRLYARHHLRRIRRFCSGGTLLEIGAGAGYFLDEARRCGFDVYGIELNRAQAHFMRSSLGIRCEEHPFGGGSFGGMAFDVIYLCNVLGHLYAPVQEFTHMAQRLNPGGLLVFETGNLGDVAPHALTLMGSFDYPEHLFFFSERALHELVRQAGLDFLTLERYTIQPQLLLSKVAQRVRGRTRVPAAAGAAAPSPSTAPGMVARLRAHTAYLLRYRLGALLPKGERLQTLVVIARKRSA